MFQRTFVVRQSCFKWCGTPTFCNCLRSLRLTTATTSSQNSVQVTVSLYIHNVLFYLNCTWVDMSLITDPELYFRSLRLTYQLWCWCPKSSSDSYTSPSLCCQVENWWSISTINQDWKKRKHGNTWGRLCLQLTTCTELVSSTGVCVCVCVCRRGGCCATLLIIVCPSTKAS